MSLPDTATMKDSLRRLEIMSTREVSEPIRLPMLVSRVENLEAALNARPGVMMTALAAFFLSASYALANIRVFWFDEFITIYIAKQGSFGSIWHLLAGGADPNPPLSHLLVLASQHLLGNSEAAIRTPFILAGLVGMLCLFTLLQEYVTPVYAAAGVFFYMTTHAFDYSYEARSYALVMCFSMLSLLAWHWSTESPHPKAALLVMTVSLALAVSSNYYGILAFFPVAAGELTYYFTSGRRRIRWKTWLALMVAAGSLVPYLGLINASVARFSPYAWNKPNPDFIIGTYNYLLGSVGYLAGLTTFAALVIYVYERIQLRKHSPRILPPHVFAAVAVLVSYPVLAYVIAVVRAGMLSERHVLPVIYGVAFAVAVAAYRIFRRSAVASLLFLLCCLSFCTFVITDTFFDYQNQRMTLMRLIAALPKTGTLAVSDPHLVLPLYYYSPAQVASRIVFPVGLEHVRKYQREDSAEQNLAAASEIYPVPQIAVQDVLSDNADLYIIAPPWNWLLRLLDDYGHPAEPLNEQPSNHSLRGFFPLSLGDCVIFRERFSNASLDSFWP